MKELGNLEGLDPAARRALLKELLKRQATKDKKGTAPPLERGRHEGRLPLSEAQERFWILQRLDPSGRAYNSVQGARLKGELDVDALKRAISEICRRHEVLRSVFPMEEGRVSQVIHAPQPFPLRELDLSDIDPGRRVVEAKRRVDELVGEPFDLQSQVPIRGALVRLDERDQILVLVVHHIAVDRWSNGVLERELGVLYEAYRAGRPSPLPELEIQYGDFALWQRKLAEEGTFEAQLRYWEHQLRDLPDSVDLPQDRARPATLSGKGGTLVRRLPLELVERLSALGREEKGSLFLVLASALLSWMNRVSRQEDLTLGISVSGRSHSKTHPLIGVFLNTLVLRGDLSGAPTFRSLLGRLREVAFSAYENQDVSFANVVHRLANKRNASLNPLFQVSFHHANQGLSGAESSLLTGLEDVPFSLETPGADMDLTINAVEHTDGLSVSWTYSTDVFDAATIERFADQFHVLLQAIAAEPDLPVSRLALMTEAERQKVLVEFNRTRVEFPRGRLLPEQFKQQAGRTPELAALAFGDENWSYLELDRRSNQLANALRRMAVGPEVRVGVCMDRSLELPMVLLAIHKAGGAYVPLDPSFPPERLAFMVEDARPALVITTSALRSSLPPDCPVLRLDVESARLAEEDERPVDAGIGPGNAAYVLYTSGSTGRPKGVVVEHGNLVNFLTGMDERLRPEGGGIWLAVTSISFDISVLELLWTLSRGFTVVVHPKESIDLIARELVRRRVTHLQCTPSMTQLVTESEGGLEAFRGLKGLLIGGEAFPAALAERLKQLVEGEIHNMYGPTETTIWSSSHRVEQVGSSISIGKPIANTTFYVLDGTGQPVPLGAMGELYIGGEGVARGYLGRPELTAERFVPNPFADGERLYRTGDVVRYLADGSVRYLGRQDHQVKVRGHRIELEEVEAALLSHAAVMEAVVVTRPDAVGSQQLVAYVVSREEGSTSGLLGYLKGKLPEYMVPSVLMELEAMPWTPNGKIDRKALPAPTQSPTETYVAPRNPVEQMLAQIWAEFLRVERVGIHDSFFELGGHSLTAISTVGRMNETLGAKVSLEDLFEAQTIANLSAAMHSRLYNEHVDTSQAPERRSPLLKLQPKGSATPLICVHPTLGSGLVFFLLPRQMGDQQPVFAINAPELTSTKTYLSIEERTAAYVELVRAALPHGPYRFLGYSSGGTLAFEMAHQLIGQGEQVEFLGLVDSGLESPTHQSAPPAWDEATLYRQFIADGAADLLPTFDSLASDDARKQYVFQMLIDEGVLPETASSGELNGMVRAATATAYAIKRYRPKPYPGPVDLFVTEEGPSTGIENWRPLCVGELRIHNLPGKHLEILSLPNVRALGGQLTTVLEGLTARRASA